MLSFLKTNIGCMSCLNDCNVFPEGGGKGAKNVQVTIVKMTMAVVVIDHHYTHPSYYRPPHPHPQKKLEL